MGTGPRIGRRGLLKLGAATWGSFALGGRGSFGLDALVARTLYRHAAIAEGRSSNLARDMSVLVSGGRISWIAPSDSEPSPGSSEGLTVIDARGLTIVPGLVDGHCHLTSPGGKNYIERFKDPPRTLLKTAEKNGALSQAAGIAWLREAGAPTVVDPVDGRRRAISLGIRDRWESRNDRPRVRAAGTWIQVPDGMTSGLGIVVRNADQLVAAVHGQLDKGADLVKLYVEAGNGSRQSPWSASEIGRAVAAAHGRGAKITAHTMWLGPARAAVMGGVDSIEHGFHLDADLCAEMARRGTYYVTTLTVPKSWLRIGSTTSGSWMSTRWGKRYARKLLAAGKASVALAKQAGVKICAGSDFGGGSTRAGQLAWEVETLVEAGLQPWQALGSATWRGGDLLGESDAGRLREGGPADFFLIAGDPYSDPSALWEVRRLA